jgi:galactokinase
VTGARRAFGPGRVNLIGEHTDNNGGLALPFAIDRGVTVTARPTEDETFHAHAATLDERDDFAEPERAEGWRAFVRGTVAELRAAGTEVAPAAIEIDADLPQGAGMSSSAALGVALALALGAPEDDKLAIARLASRVENDWTGARTGLLDQLASLHGRSGGAVLIDFTTLAVDPVPLDLGDWSLVLADSHAAHEHAAGGYNERRAECERAAQQLGVEHLAQADPAAAAALPDPLDRRVRHVLEEDDRVRAAVGALHDGDLPALGRLLDASHVSLRDLFEVSVPAVEETRDRLLAAGAAGARIMGGGFGGSVLALLPPGTDVPEDAVVVVPGAGASVASL